MTFSSIFIVHQEKPKTSISNTNSQAAIPKKHKMQLLANDFSTMADSGLIDAGNWASSLSIDESGVLGVAANFNIFANYISNSNNQSLLGNFATKSLLNDNNWNPVGKSNTLSYIQSEVKSTVTFNNNSGKLIFGEKFSYNKDSTMLTDGNNTVKIANTGLYRESSNQIDFDNEFSRLKENSKKLLILLKITIR